MVDIMVSYYIPVKMEKEHYLLMSTEVYCNHILIEKNDFLLYGINTYGLPIECIIGIYPIE